MKSWKKISGVTQNFTYGSIFSVFLFSPFKMESKIRFTLLFEPKFIHFYNPEISNIFSQNQKHQRKVAATHFSISESDSAVSSEWFASAVWPSNLVENLAMEKVSISPTFYRQLASSYKNVFFCSFSLLTVWLCNFWRKIIVA